jgi:hypothetical protein
MMLRFGKLLMMALWLALASAPFAAAQESVETLRFRPGSETTTVRGIVAGRIGVSYRVEARAGQRMSVTLRGSNKFLYFNVIDPRGRTIAREETRWSDQLRASGSFRIQIYLLRSEARRNTFAPFTLEVRLGGRGMPPKDGPGRLTYRVVGVPFDDVLNMRERPNPRSFPVGEIPFDATGIRGLGCNEDNTWCRVRYGGHEGWVNARFIRPE